LKKLIFFLFALAFLFSFAACSPEDAVRKVFGDPKVIVEIVDSSGNALPDGSPLLGTNSELYEDSFYYLKGTIYIKGRPVSEGDSLSKEIEWKDVTPGYKIIDFIELSSTNNETLSGQVMQIKTKTLQGADTQKDALITVKAFFAQAPEKQYRFTVIKKVP
jgi:hypothetical protein